ncbi:MAG: CRISPR-associated helicase Cas3' [Lachnospiraceae bacterium]|nr:CRISPR-associated helicase Cas3' [Lachnospiraceae bacterium]
MKYLAHISEDGLREQTVEEHCENVAELAAQFAEPFHAESWGYCAGIMHDVGKATTGFQNRLLHDGPRVDHSTAGAQELLKREGMYPLLAYCVVGHHAGLPDKGTEADSADSGTLCGRGKKKILDCHEYMNNVEAPTLESPEIKYIKGGGFSVAFFLRMIYSCLVDADFLDTEDFMDDGKTERQPGKAEKRLLDALLEYVSPWLKNTNRETVNGRRTEILKASLEMGKKEPGIYSMTVPTGGGKTVASLAFALEHACTYGKDRIIYVIPYTSIIEQNAQVFRDILGDDAVLENHSNIDYGESEELKPMQLAAENWDKPVVVTTNVQFFESFFANGPAKCRKLHNVANSVIIFDEAQKLPTQYLIPCVRVMEELAVNYGCTIELCTATQPSLDWFFSENIKIQEICPRVHDQFQFFKRTEVKNIGTLSEEEFVEHVRVEKQALCIFNNRKRVQRIYKELQGEGIYHLSTLMYPIHRKRKLNEIRDRLKHGEKCVVIATSLVEAGVDVDFQFVYRELAGVDSIVQAAGRCNREGLRRLDESTTYVFTFQEKAGMASELRQPVEISKNIVEDFSDISSLEAIESYFQQLHYIKGEQQLDRDHIVEQFEKGAKTGSYPFASVAEQFKLIKNNTKLILIEKEPEAKRLIDQLRYGEKSRKLIRKLGNYGVQVYEQDFESLNSAGFLEILDQWNSEVAVLRDDGKYSEDMGLEINEKDGEVLIW